MAKTKSGLAIIIGAGRPPGTLAGGVPTGAGVSGRPDGVDEHPPGKQTDPTELSDLSGGDQTDTVPLAALAMPDDTEQMQPPEVGDEVNYQVTGKVVGIDGGLAQVAKTAVNGQPVGGDESMDPAAGQDEGQSLREEAAGLPPGMLGVILTLLLALAFAPLARAQNAAIEGYGVMTNQCLLPNLPARIYRLMGYNNTNTTIYVQVFQTNAVPLTGAIPLMIQPVTAGAAYAMDFSYYGCQMDACVVCASTTAATLSLAPTPCVSIVSIESQR